MQEKAKRAQEYFQKHRKPLPVGSEGFDELAYFGGRAGVIQAGKGCGEEQQRTPLPNFTPSRRSATSTSSSGSVDNQAGARLDFGQNGPTTEGIHLGPSPTFVSHIGVSAASPPATGWDLHSLGHSVNLQQSFASSSRPGGNDEVYANRDADMQGLAIRGSAYHGAPMSSMGSGQEPLQWSVSAGDETLYDRWSLYLGAEPQSGNSEGSGPGPSQANFRHLRQSDLGHGNGQIGQ